MTHKLSLLDEKISKINTKNKDVSKLVLTIFISVA